MKDIISAGKRPTQKKAVKASRSMEEEETCTAIPTPRYCLNLHRKQ